MDSKCRMAMNMYLYHLLLQKLKEVVEKRKQKTTELIQLARDNADYTNEIDVLRKLEDHEKRLKALEEGKSTLEPGPDEYPEYVAGKWYYKDDKITYNKKHYKCIAPIGQVCTWNPDEYPAYWEEVV